MKSPLSGCWRDPLPTVQVRCGFALLSSLQLEQSKSLWCETHSISPGLNGFPSDSPRCQEEEGSWHRLTTAEFLPSVHQEVIFLYLFEVILYVKKQ